MSNKGQFHISPEAIRALSGYVRQWAGWDDCHVTFDTKSKAPASCNHKTRRVTVNPEALILNPNRVLNSVTPFRLRQEAVLTGALLHEAGHARHSRWLPRTKKELAALRATPLEIWLARLIEEPRVEGLMHRDAENVGARGLNWTMYASAAHLVPVTTESMDPGQEILALIQSWLLRAARRHAARASGNLWVGSLDSALCTGIARYLHTVGTPGVRMAKAQALAMDCVNLLKDGACEASDTGDYTPLRYAREVIEILFPETDDQPEPPSLGLSCSASGGSGTSGEDAESGDGEDAESGDGEDAEPGDSEGAESGDSEGAESGDSEGSDLARWIADLRRTSEDVFDERAKAEAEKNQAGGSENKSENKSEQEASSSGAGRGDGKGQASRFRSPTPDDRDTAKQAGAFLRALIDPSESSKRSLSESPSATVDGAALAAWKAGGQVRQPRFFHRTTRVVQPSAPVKVAILVDVSGSMDAAQIPSAVLAWSLASAAQDLANFAGRGQQIEVVTVHWGDSARLIQKNGEALPGVPAPVPCREGTYAMAAALEAVEREIPGFFDPTQDGKPTNRLLVQFTDWGLSSPGAVLRAKDLLGRALGSGVNMLSVVPPRSGRGRGDLENVLRLIKEQRGRSVVVPLRGDGASVWAEASRLLSLG